MRACESASSDVVFISTPTRRMRSCARAASGHAADTPPSSNMNSRRFTPVSPVLRPKDTTAADAKALGFEIPATLLARADEVIE